MRQYNDLWENAGCNVRKKIKRYEWIWTHKYFESDLQSFLPCYVGGGLKRGERHLKYI